MNAYISKLTVRAHWTAIARRTRTGKVGALSGTRAKPTTNRTESFIWKFNDKNLIIKFSRKN